MVHSSIAFQCAIQLGEHHFHFKVRWSKVDLIELMVVAFGRVSVRYLVSKVIKGSEWEKIPYTKSTVL